MEERRGTRERRKEGGKERKRMIARHFLASLFCYTFTQLLILWFAFCIPPHAHIFYPADLLLHPLVLSVISPSMLLVIFVNSFVHFLFHFLLHSNSRLLLVSFPHYGYSSNRFKYRQHFLSPQSVSAYVSKSAYYSLLPVPLKAYNYYYGYSISFSLLFVSSASLLCLLINPIYLFSFSYQSGP